MGWERIAGKQWIGLRDSSIQVSRVESFRYFVWSAFDHFNSGSTLHFGCTKDFWYEPSDATMLEVIASGAEPFMIVGTLLAANWLY